MNEWGKEDRLLVFIQGIQDGRYVVLSRMTPDESTPIEILQERERTYTRLGPVPPAGLLFPEDILDTLQGRYSGRAIRQQTGSIQGDIQWLCATEATHYGSARLMWETLREGMDP